MKPETYHYVRSVDESVEGTGEFGKALFRFKERLRWYILAIAVYALGTTGFAVWAFLGPSFSNGKKVLRTGDVKVDQFYSGLALSVLLAPAAILIRRIAHDLALLNPFAIASKVPTRIADLDVMMDPGVFAAARLARYSFTSAAIQGLLLLSGAFLVPVGTLLVTTGSYAAPERGIAVIGMPTEWQNMMTMSIDMGTYGVSEASAVQDLTGYDAFAALAMDIFQGTVVKQAGALTDTASQLGPISTPNMTLGEGVRYDGIVTYTWSSGCEYTDEISYSETTGEYEWLFNITSPAGSVISIDAWESRFFAWNETNANIKSPTTAYYAAIGTVQETVNIKEAADGINVVDGAWISRVKCNPQFSWEVSNCLWRNGSMGDCIAAPGHNTTELDVEGLDFLKYYFARIPFWIYQRNAYVFGLSTIQVPLMFDFRGTNDHDYRAPVLADYDRMYGAVAQSLASTTSAGYYGTAEVPTEGSAPRPVYVLRTYILVIVMFTLLAVPLLTVFNIYHYLASHVPLRRATFLAVANAVRGPWWDSQLWGGCALSPEELRARYGNTLVMFGVDERHPKHIGFAPDTLHIQKEQQYYGLETERG